MAAASLEARARAIVARSAGSPRHRPTAFAANVEKRVNCFLRALTNFFVTSNSFRNECEIWHNIGAMRRLFEQATRTPSSVPRHATVIASATAALS
jgi:hypothetical protein